MFFVTRWRGRATNETRAGVVLGGAGNFLVGGSGGNFRPESLSGLTHKKQKNMDTIDLTLMATVVVSGAALVAFAAYDIGVRVGSTRERCRADRHVTGVLQNLRRAPKLTAGAPKKNRRARK